MEQKKPKILTIGSANMDMTLRLTRVPSPGETLIDNGSVSYSPGGKTANAAAAFAKLGADCVFCTRLGADTHGQRLYNTYRSLGIDTQFITVDKTVPTGFAAVLVEADGQNRIIVYPGANAGFTREDVDAALTCAPDAIFLQFEIPFEIVEYILHQAYLMRIPVFIDGGPASADYRLEALPSIELFSPNEEETFVYTGIRPTGADSCLRAAIELQRRVRARYYVLKLGDRGAYIYDGRLCHMIASYTVAAVDTTAAGDAFTAALTLEYLRNGGNMPDACRFANAVGALTVMREGSTTAIPTAAEVADFMRRHA